VRHFIAVLSLQLIKVNGSGTYIFKFAAAFCVGANTEIILKTAEASEVFWIAEGLAIGTDAKNERIPYIKFWMG
jgi:hypothetical protein